jgi:DNA-binding PadR family transcriptional regulator
MRHLRDHIFSHNHEHLRHFMARFGHGHGRGPGFDHRDEHGRHFGRGHRGGPGRFFESGDLRFVLLHLISDAPRHGYEIIKLIENRMAGAHSPSPGIVYPTLTMLEEMGLAEVKTEGARKLYSITDLGRSELDAHRAATDAILERMQRAGERHARDESGPIARALENLKLVLRMRSAELSPDQVAAVTDIIDEAAKRIERL